MTETQLVRVDSIHVGYGDMTVLRDVSFAAAAGTVTALAGANGAGKTTLLKAVLGMLPATSGSLWLGDREVTKLSVTERITLGIGLVPEGRGLFGTMSVRDNLLLGGRACRIRGAALKTAIDSALNLFPALTAKLDAAAGSLSGGQQQMLSLARTLVASPQVVLLDEPSMGLAPKIWSELLALARSLADEGRAVVLAEQKIRPVLDISDHCVVLQRGRVVYNGPSDGDQAERSINSAYLEMATTAGGTHG